MTNAEGSAMQLRCATNLCPSSPLGDIWVSEELIAQKGEAYVREMIRREIDAAYSFAHRQKEFKNGR